MHIYFVYNDFAVDFSSLVFDFNDERMDPGELEIDFFVAGVTDQ